MANTNTDTSTNNTNKARIAELQKGEADGRLTDEEAAELQKLQNETSADGAPTK